MSGDKTHMGGIYFLTIDKDTSVSLSVTIDVVIRCWVKEITTHVHVEMEKQFQSPHLDGIPRWNSLIIHLVLPNELYLGPLLFFLGSHSVLNKFKDFSKTSDPTWQSMRHGSRLIRFTVDFVMF